jgi:hypothetical protein
MIDITPRTAMQALRLAKTTEAAAKLDVTIWPNGDGTALVDSWKADENGAYRYTRYTVDLNNFTCTCADYAARGRYCKHLIHLKDVAEEEDREEMLLARIAEMEQEEDGQAFMSNMHTERALAY